MTMNLTTDPWIPVLRAEGTRALVSLCDVFAHAHTLRDLSAKPHERIALMRLLLCITQAALDGPRDEDAWQDCLPLIQPRVAMYLEKWQGAFELFGDGPRFLQVRLGVIAEAMPAMVNEGLSRLNLCLASGESNATLFDNSATEDREFTCPQAALSLLTYQCYSPLLGCGYKGRSPCADENMLHTFMLGENLLESVWLNLITTDTITSCYSPHGLQRPVWEKMPAARISPDKHGPITRSYLGRLVPPSRSIWLESLSRFSLANGLDYEAFEDCGFREAAATVIARDSKLSLLKVRADRALWRELPAICVTMRQADGVSGPLAFRNPATASEVRIWAGALVFPKLNAKIEDSVESANATPFW